MTLDEIKAIAASWTDKVTGAVDNAFDYAGSKLPQVGDDGISVPGFAGQNALSFLRNNAGLAAATTLGAGAVAGGLSASDERPGESKVERLRRSMRNAAIVSGLTGTGWLAGSGLAGVTGAANAKVDKSTGKIPNVATNDKGYLEQIKAPDEGWVSVVKSVAPGLLGVLPASSTFNAGVASLLGIGRTGTRTVTRQALRPAQVWAAIRQH
jgi:hypothetical protein